MEQQIESYLEYLILKGKRPTTAKNYRLYLKKFSKYCGNIPVESITQKHIIGFQQSLTGNGLSPATSSFHIVALKSFYKYLTLMQYKVIPPETIEIPSYRKKEAQFLSQ